MTARTDKERQILGTILLCTSAFAGVMAVVYLIKFIFFNDNFMNTMVAIAFAATMVFGALLGIGLNYTIRVPRGKDDDRSQVIAAMIFILLGVVVCASLQIVEGVHPDYWLIPVVFYVQNGIMFLVATYSLKFYFKK